MFWIVTTVILGLCFWGGIIYWAMTRGSGEGNTSLGGLGVAAIAAIIWVIASVGLSVHTVGQREVAIVYNFSGTIAGKKDAGVVNTMPWQHIKKENIGIQHEEFDLDTTNAAVSKDQQQIFARLFLNYRIEPEHVVDLYKNVGPGWKAILLDARVLQDFKEITATFTTPEITANREQLRVRTKQRLQQELNAYDIKVVDVFVKNLGFSQSYQDAIERKQKQVQDALTAQAKVNQVEAEANQKVAEANGAARAAIAEAKGQATANVVKARGDATANKLRSRTLTNRLIQLAAIEKLNPDVSVIVCPPQSVCIPNSGVIPQP
jgi:regulator of protease activity HflC (stomatin/prohibitin superfamily)